MSTSTILLDQNVRANNVDITVFEPSVLFHPPPPAAVWGEIDDMVRNKVHIPLCRRCLL